MCCEVLQHSARPSDTVPRLQRADSRPQALLACTLLHNTSAHFAWHTAPAQQAATLNPFECTATTLCELQATTVTAACG